MLSYTLVNPPVWATVASGLLKIAKSAPPGVHTLTVQISNGQTTSTKQIAVTVKPKVAIAQQYFAVAKPIESLIKFSLGASISKGTAEAVKFVLSGYASVYSSIRNVTGSPRIAFDLTGTAAVSGGGGGRGGSSSDVTTVDLAKFTLSATVAYTGSAPTGYSSSIATPLGASGLAQIVNAYAYDTFVAIPDVGFDLSLYGVNRRAGLHICSNSSITFGYGSTIYANFSETNPGAGLFVGAGDRSWHSVWAGGTANSYRIRFEGNSYYNGSSAPDSFWETTFFSDGTIMLVSGATELTTNGHSSITDGLGGNAAAFTIAANSSWVFQPNGSGGYTVQTGSYSL